MLNRFFVCKFTLNFEPVIFCYCDTASRVYVQCNHWSLSLPVTLVALLFAGVPYLSVVFVGLFVGHCFCISPGLFLDSVS